MSATTSEASFHDAKAFLLSGSEQGRSLYDHLSDVLLRVLEQRPADALARFEQESLSVKQAAAAVSLSGGAQAAAQAAAFRKVATAFESAQIKLQEQALQVFLPRAPKLDADGQPVEEEANDGVVDDVEELLYYLSKCGVGVAREEGARMQLALQRLVESKPLVRARLFGKFLGRSGDYVVAEAEFKEGQHPDELKPAADENADADAAAAAAADADGDADGENKAKQKKKSSAPPPVPAEKRAGTNRLVYFVCSFAGANAGDWELLPDVTPQQISVARQVRKFLTGSLDAPVDSFPAFPGTERNLLRAQIARIAAATTVSPKGLLLLPGEDAGEDGGNVFEPKASYEKQATEDLAKPDGWVHHAQHILQQQGRCEFYAPPKPEGDDAGDDAAADTEAETGPEIGAALADDAPVNGTVPAWTARVSSKRSKFPVAFLRSNRWPGAFAYAADGGKKFGVFYVGYGVKFTGLPYNPPLPAPVKIDVGAVPTEAADPSADEESAFERAEAEARAAAEAAAAAAAAGEGEGDAPAE